MKIPTTEELTAAKKARDKRLARLTAIYDACTCAYPITIIRTRSGHPHTCPADAVHEKYRKEDEAMRKELRL